MRMYALVVPFGDTRTLTKFIFENVHKFTFGRTKVEFLKSSVIWKHCIVRLVICEGPPI